MKKAGGLIALIAGIFAVFAAGATLLLGGTGAAFEMKDADLILWLGVGGLVSSFAVIVLGALSMNARSRIPPAMLMAVAVIGAIVGGTFVAVFMALALVGALLALISDYPPAMAQAPAAAGIETSTSAVIPPEAADQPRVDNTLIWLVALLPLIGLAVEIAMAAVLEGAGIAPVDESYVWIAYLALYGALCWWDEDRLEGMAGLDTSRLSAWMCLLVPVYLFRRARVCGHKLHYFTTWVVCFVISIVLAATVATDTFETASAEATVAADELSAFQEETGEVEETAFDKMLEFERNPSSATLGDALDALGELNKDQVASAEERQAKLAALPKIEPSVYAASANQILQVTENDVTIYVGSGGQLTCEGDVSCYRGVGSIHPREEGFYNYTAALLAECSVHFTPVTKEGFSGIQVEYLGGECSAHLENAHQLKNISGLYETLCETEDGLHPCSELKESSNPLQTSDSRSAKGPSFNCSGSLTSVERMVCSDPELAEADANLADLYAKVKAAGADPNELKTGQRAFLKTRNKCTTVECIAEVYRVRHEALAIEGWVGN
jgi:hypothetical protein